MLLCLSDIYVLKRLLFNCCQLDLLKICCLYSVEGKWKVWVTTNELPSAGTQAQVTLTVYGHRGCTKPIPLGSSDGQTFQAGNVDEFTVCNRNYTTSSRGQELKLQSFWQQ